MKTYMFPGQGSQIKGMGATLFEEYQELTGQVDDLLGYSIVDLCLNNPRQQLGQTQFTQPALYVVNALNYRKILKDQEAKPDFLIGHSLGEFNALEASGAISFEDGLRLVKKRGELMSQAPAGAMAAVIGIPVDSVRDILKRHDLSGIDIANLNGPTQTIISGQVADLNRAQDIFQQQDAHFIPLNTSGAFHSRYMKPAQQNFEAFLSQFEFSPLSIPVISNARALPYQQEQIPITLVEQICQSVRWAESIHYLLKKGEMVFVELGPGNVLTKLVNPIKKKFDNTRTEQAIKPPVEKNTENRLSELDTAKKHLQQKIDDWNSRYPVGTKVKAANYDQPLETRTKAMILFGHRGAIYMKDFNGYFALDEVSPLN